MPCIKVIGVAFSLIVIMQQTKFLLCRVYPLAFSNILQKDSKNVSMVVKFLEYEFYRHMTPHFSGCGLYRYRCDRVECDEEYIGESARTFAERFKEHLKALSPTHDHSNRSGHDVSIHNFSIVGREDQNIIRTIKEALYIRVNNPSLNKNIGKYHLPHIWDEVLCNSPELKLK